MKKLLLLFAICLYATNAEAYDENGDVFCLAQNMYFEAGGESTAGQLAVGLVTLNRVKMWQYPNSVCAVIQQGPTYTNWKGNELPVKDKCQFSWYCDGKSDWPEDSKTFEKMLQLAAMLMDNEIYDFTEGSNHYHNNTVKPYWSDHLEQTVTIDNHIFYK